MTSPYISSVPLYTVLISLAAVPLILVSSRRPNLREFWTIAASFVKFGLVLSLLPDVLSGRIPEISVLELSPGIELALRVDELGIFFALVASGLWILTSFYSIGYMRGAGEGKQTRYFASFAVCLSSTIGIAFSANLLTFLLFYEVLTVATYPLVVHKETKEAIHAGRKYLVYTLSAGVILIAATGWTFAMAESVEFQPGGLLRTVPAGRDALRGLFLLFVAGVGVKSAVMPLHSWLPTAMAAPTPVSALLHAVAVVKSGVFGVLRVVGFIFGPEVMREHGLNTVLGVLAGVTIITASLIAFRENNLKRLLAYSTVGHLSYIVLGAALVTPAGFTGGLLHLANHATMKITLFFCAGAIYVNLHKESVDELDGIARSMPWTMGAFTIAAVGLVGIPPLNGFISKWYLGLGSLESGTGIALAVFLASGLLNAGYMFPVIYRAYFLEGVGQEGHGEASATMVVPLFITAILSVLLGLSPDFSFRFFELAMRITGSVFGGVGV